MDLLAQLTIDLASGGDAGESSDLANHPWLSELITSFMDTTPIIGILVILMFLDVVTGYFAAGISGEIDSTISYKGAMKKAQMLLAVAAGTVFERIQPGIPWGKIIASLAAVGEMWSILENMAKSGVPMPQALRDTLIRLRAANKDKDTSALVSVHVNETNGAAIKDAVKQLKDSNRDVVHDVCDRIGGRIQTLQADVKEVLHDSGVFKHSELTDPPRKDA